MAKDGGVAEKLDRDGEAMPYIRTKYSPRVRVQLKCAGGRTRQSFAAECDINNIMARYMKTGALEHVARVVPRFGDVTGQDFQQAMDLVANARSAFEDLPSALRSRFDNDPAMLLEFMQDPENRAEAVKLGLVRKEEPAPVEPAPEGPSAVVETPVGQKAQPGGS